MIHFESAYMLIGLPGVAVVYYIFRISQNHHWGKLKAWVRMTEGDQFIKQKEKSIRSLRWILAGIAWIIIALANPQMGSEEITSTTTRRDVYIAIDISKSMDATDTPPSRLEVAKKKTAQLIESLKGNRFSILFFAGTTYLAMPLTTDYRAAVTLVGSCSTDQAGIQGTDIAGVGEAVESAHKRNGKGTADLVIITDGEDHESGGLDQIEKLSRAGVKVHVVGAGTEEGGAIMLPEGVMTDEEGNVVQTRLNKALIQALAEAGSGKVLSLDDKQWINELAQTIENNGSGKELTQSYRHYKSYAWVPILFAWLCIVYIWLPFAGAGGVNLIKRKATAVIGVLFFAITANAQTHPKFLEGNEAFRKGKFDEAVEAYSKGLEETDNAAAWYNKGNGQYRKGDMEGAIQSYESAKGRLKLEEQQYKLHHNLGNAYLKAGKIQEAIQSYKEALRIKPGAEPTAINLAKARQQQQQQQQQSEDDPSSKSSKDQRQSENQPGQKEDQKSSGEKSQKDPSEGKQKQPSTSQNEGGKRDESKNSGNEWSEQEALLDYIEREEKKVQQQLRRGEGKARKPQKPW